MDPKNAEFVGVDSLYYALLTKDDSSAYTPGSPVKLAPAAEVAANTPVNTVSGYYDNESGDQYVAEAPTEIKLVLSNVDAETMAILLGKKYISADGIVYDSGQADAPDCALGFRYNMGKSGYRYYWYYKGVFSGGEEAAASKKENVEIKTYEMSFRAVPTAFEFTVDGEKKKLKRVFGDTADANFDGAGWFTAVKVPVVV